MEREDLYSQSQNHWTPGFNRERNYIHNYQNSLDARLSKPKQLQKVDGKQEEKFFKNTSYGE